jgi:regulator of protease activity HflC (stomatin/prohibitin superfamily)
VAEALGWLGAIVEWLGQFFPRWKVVPTTEGWVKFVKGTRVVSGGAGIVWYWPATTVFMFHPTTRQAIDLRGQTVTTADGVPLLVGGLITYQIFDIEKALAHTWQPDETIRDTALTAVQHVIKTRTYAEVNAQDKTGDLQRALRKEARRVLETYGVRVIKLSITDLARTRVVKVSLTSDTV